MTDREKYLTILDRFYRGRGQSLLTKDESEALDYAISSIKTDLKYDLLFEETNHIADTDKMIEPTTKNDLGVDAVSRQAVLDLVADYDLSMGQVVKGIHALPSVTPQESIDYKTQYENYLKKSEVVISQLRADRDRLQDAFNKLRAEIVGITKCLYGTECLGANCPSNTDCMICGDHVLEIIDKYKTESGE